MLLFSERSRVCTAPYYYHTPSDSMLLYQCADCEKGVVCETLAFMSDDKVHDFHAVQTFVCLAMEHLGGRRQLDVHRVIQWTDGCASQYKSKGPYSDISHATSELDCVQLERHLFGLRHSLIKHHVDSAVKLNQAVVSHTKEMFEYLQQSFTKDLPGPCSHSKRVFLPRSRWRNWSAETWQNSKDYCRNKKYALSAINWPPRNYHRYTSTQLLLADWTNGYTCEFKMMLSNDW